MRRAFQAGCSRASSSSPKAADALRSELDRLSGLDRAGGETNPHGGRSTPVRPGGARGADAQPVRIRSPGKRWPASTSAESRPLVTTDVGKRPDPDLTGRWVKRERRLES